MENRFDSENNIYPGSNISCTEFLKRLSACFQIQPIFSFMFSQLFVRMPYHDVKKPGRLKTSEMTFVRHCSKHSDAAALH